LFVFFAKGEFLHSLLEFQGTNHPYIKVTYSYCKMINLINDAIIHQFSPLSKMKDQPYTKHPPLLKYYQFHDALNNYIQFSIWYKPRLDHLQEVLLKNHPKLISLFPNYSHFLNCLANSDLLKKNYCFWNVLINSMDSILHLYLLIKYLS